MNEKDFRDRLLIFSADLKKLASKNITSPEYQIANRKKIDYLSNTFYSESKGFLEEYPHYEKLLLAFRTDSDTGKEEISSSSPANWLKILTLINLLCFLRLRAL